MRTYRFPSQETKLREGGKATVPGIDGPPSTVAIEALDRDACTITLKVGVARAELLTDRLTLHPDWPLDTKVLAAAVRDVIEDPCGPRRYRAVDDLLSGAAPRLKDRKSVVSGKRVSVRVDLVGRRTMKKKKHHH